MNSRQYSLAGWLAIVLAVILFPTIAGGVLLDYLAPGLPIADLVNFVLSIINCVLAVYILLIFRKLLNIRFEFHRTDTIIMGLIWFNIFFAFVGLSKFVLVNLGIVGIVTLVVGGILFLIFGILNVLFGIKILYLKEDLFGLLKPFAYLQIIAGVCLLSILLSPIGLLAAVAALIVQAIIFLRAAEDVQFV